MCFETEDEDCIRSGKDLSVESVYANTEYVNAFTIGRTSENLLRKTLNYIICLLSPCRNRSATLGCVAKKYSSGVKVIGVTNCVNG